MAWVFMVNNPLPHDKVNKTKNSKGAGRKRNFTTEQLLEIINSYKLEGYPDVANASKIARYAIETLKYTDIAYHHFTQDDAAKEEIEKLKTQNKQRFADNSILSFLSYEIDAFVDRNINNPLKLKNELYDVQIAQKAMYQRMIKQEVVIRELKSQLNSQVLKDTLTDNKELKKEIKELKDTVIQLNRLIDVDNHMKMCKYIWDNSLIEPENLVDQYITTLLKCKVVKDTDIEEILKASDFINIDESAPETEDDFIEFTHITDKGIEQTQSEEILEGSEYEEKVDLMTLLGYDN